MKCKHSTLMILSGLVWLAIGMGLLILGLQFIVQSLQPTSSHILSETHFSLIKCMAPLHLYRENAVIFIIFIALLVGSIKGRFVLAKSAKRQITRIQSLPNPAPLRALYGKGYYILIGCMMSLGFIMRLLPITLDTRGAIDVLIGSALIQGSLFYFRTKPIFSSKEMP